MKIASVTLTGNNESIIADALKSVIQYVDNCIVVDTGSTDKSLEIAREVVGDKLIIKSFPWINDFSAARNYCLQVAAELQFDWVLILDTDERINWNGQDVSPILNSFNVGSLMVNSIDKTYCKTRFIKLPSPVHFYGPTHEVYPSYKVGTQTLDKMTFSEVGKTSEQLIFKFNRDVEILLKHTSENPKDPRWFYYLGDSYKNLKKFPEAIESYQKCWELNGWDEESAWSMFKSAECYVALGNYTKAIECCGKGLSRHPGIAELAWLAGWCCYRTGLSDKAIKWSKIALTLGNVEGFADSDKRIGFRHPPGLYEGPYDVLRWTYKEKLKTDPENKKYKNEIKKYEEMFTKAINLRLGRK